MIGLLGKGLNSGGWARVQEILCSKAIACETIADHRAISAEHACVLSIGYSRIIPRECLDKPRNGVIVFHSSDLPRGRGWAPLYYTLVGHHRFLTQTMFYADEGVDSGDIIAKARYPLDKLVDLTAAREIDDHLTCLLVERFIDDVVKTRMPGTPQNHDEATYFERRRPPDSRISPESRLVDLVDVLRALPPDAPAFFEIDGARVQVRMLIEQRCVFEKDKAVVDDLRNLQGQETA